STLIINDHRMRIRFYCTGWPGSVHDNRIFRNVPVYNDALSYFDVSQYIIGDSAFEPTWFMIPCYKCLPDEALPPKQVKFNGILSDARVLSENTIGILKSRFPFLRQIRKQITT